MAVTVILPVSARVRVLYGSPAMPLRWKSASADDRHAACGRAADGWLHPARHTGEPSEPRTEPQQRIGEGDRDNGRQQPQQRIPDQRGGLGQRVVALHVKDGVGAQNRVFDDSRQRGGDNHAGKHGLVEVADQFFKREGYGGNRRVKGRGDARRHAHGSHAAGVLGAEPGHARQHAADARAHLHRRSFKAQRSAGANLEGAQNKLADCLADRDQAVPQGVGHLHLRNAAACRCGSKVGKAHAGNQAAKRGGKDGPPYPAMPRSRVGAVDQTAPQAP